ncbi:MAG: PAS domain-containing protein, partial [Oscillatoria sp. PMC 1068.18]|nr:PAS domain-containing protein [Oscillatoria sp. PMC 1068.18]
MIINLENSSILDSFVDVFFALDSWGRFTYMNVPAEELFLTSKEELIGKCIWEKFPELAKTNFEQQFNCVKSRKVNVKFEMFYEPGQMWFEATISPDKEKFIVSLRDISECKQKCRLASLQAKILEITVAQGSLATTLQKYTEVIVNQLELSYAVIWTYNSQKKKFELTAFSKAGNPHGNEVQQEYSKQQQNIN